MLGSHSFEFGLHKLHGATKTEQQKKTLLVSAKDQSEFWILSPLIPLNFSTSVTAKQETFSSLTKRFLISGNGNHGEETCNPNNCFSCETIKILRNYVHLLKYGSLLGPHGWQTVWTSRESFGALSYAYRLYHFLRQFIA